MIKFLRLLRKERIIVGEETERPGKFDFLN